MEDRERELFARVPELEGERNALGLVRESKEDKIQKVVDRVSELEGERDVLRGRVRAEKDREGELDARE